MKVVKETEQYFIYQWMYKDMPITIREWKLINGLIEMKVDEFFARANGFNTVNEMIAKTVGEHKIKKMFGRVPDWIRINRGGNFEFVGVNKLILN